MEEPNPPMVSPSISAANLISGLADRTIRASISGSYSFRALRRPEATSCRKVAAFACAKGTSKHLSSVMKSDLLRALKPAEHLSICSDEKAFSILNINPSTNGVTPELNSFSRSDSLALRSIIFESISCSRYPISFLRSSTLPALFPGH